MSRFERPPFNFAQYTAQPDPELKNRLFFDWWCDEDDRPKLLLELLQNLPPVLHAVPTRTPVQNDPAPPLDQRTPQGYRDLVLLSQPDDLLQALTRHEQFSNIPYAALGGASFLLGQDPGNDPNGIDWHAEQKRFVAAALRYPGPGLVDLARKAIEQAALTALAPPLFDLALFAEQAALRYFGLLYGYAFQDHALLEDASRAVYRALQYLAIGKHFVTEPGTLPAAQQALGQLVARTSELMEAYTELARSPRRYGEASRRTLPDGVPPWSELGLSHLSPPGPVLKHASSIASPLSGRDRAIVLATMLAGTVGNVQSAVCLLVQKVLTDSKGTRLANWRASPTPAAVEVDLPGLMTALPPIPVLPRRTRDKAVVLSDGRVIPPNTDCLLLIHGQLPPFHGRGLPIDPWTWGEVPADSPRPAVHGCPGRMFSGPLIAGLVHHTVRLNGIKHALDPLTGERLKAERLWGFACTRYPLRYERERVRVQQNLIVSMRVKPPISDNAARLRRLIAAAVPRIDEVLTGFGHVHFASFEFSDGDTQLVLRTIYDGPLESYLQHFAVRAGDLFDGLFEFIEDAPPRPVAEHPKDFVETIRRYNRAPLAGYLYSAYPEVKANQARGAAETKP